MMTIGPLSIEPHWFWLIAAVVFGVAEMLIPGVFLIWLAAAAAATGLLTLAFGPSIAAQFILFALLALAACWVGRRWYIDRPVPSSDPLLNDRAARLIGETVTVAEAIVAGKGRVKVGDGAWNANGPDLPEGALARVVGVDRGALVVEPL